MKLRCRDDTVPKTVDTRSHCKVWLRACNNLPQPPPYISVFWGCGRFLHALNHTLQWLLVSTVFGTVSSLHLNFIFNDFYTCLYKKLSPCQLSGQESRVSWVRIPPEAAIWKRFPQALICFALFSFLKV